MRPLHLGLVLLLGLPSCTRARALFDKDSAATPAATAAAALTSAPPTNSSSGVTAFPGAEGFGAHATGGRGGTVCRVTTLAHAGAGSLQACFDQSGRRTVVFDIAGVIAGPLEIKHGQLTIAGQTAPGGVTIKGGVVCDNVYDPNDCNDVIVRHVRFRGGDPDSFRIGGAHDVILDHCSFASAEDENIEITRSRNVTVQYSIIAEPRGEHYKWGGVLINYSKDVMPLDAITIHHSMWSGVAGRLPELSCEENADGPGTSNCVGHVLSIELANNVLWDVSDPIWFNRCTGTNEGNDCPPSATNFGVHLNLVGNVLARRSAADADQPFLEPAAFASPKSVIYTNDNALFRGPTRAASAIRPGVAARHAFPPVTYTPSAALPALLARTVGAFPRDAMDTRLASYLGKPIDARPVAWRNEQGLEVGDAFARLPATAVAPDGDHDGIPDSWEASHGLDPAGSNDGAGSSRLPSCAGYTNLECYLNEIATVR